MMIKRLGAALITVFALMLISNAALASSVSYQLSTPGVV